MKAVQAHDLEKRFGSKAVLSGLQLSIDEGSVYGLLGRNGAGKTTLITTLVGLMRPDRGEAQVLGVDLRTSVAGRRQVAYVPETDLLPGWAAIRDLIRLEKSCRDDWEDEALGRWLAREGLTPGRLVHTLSKGQRKRLEIELAAAARPLVFLLDEPFAGLDPVSRSEAMKSLLSWLAESGATVLLSSHDLGDLERLCDRIGVLANGRVELEVALDDLKDGGAVVTAAASEPPPGLSTHVLASRAIGDGRLWVMTGLGPESRATLQEAGYRVVTGGLESLGVELLLCLEQRKELSS